MFFLIYYTENGAAAELIYLYSNSINRSLSFVVIWDLLVTIKERGAYNQSIVSRLCIRYRAMHIICFDVLFIY